jgi:hypothetical protein
MPTQVSPDFFDYNSLMPPTPTPVPVPYPNMAVAGAWPNQSPVKVINPNQNPKIRAQVNTKINQLVLTASQSQLSKIVLISP